MNIIYYNESSVFDELSSDEHYLIAIDSNLVSTHQVELPKMSQNFLNLALKLNLKNYQMSEKQILDDSYLY
jgi:hypothetical protein